MRAAQAVAGTLAARHIALLTLGDPTQLTGGYLFHQRMAAAAPKHDAELAFVSLPQRPFPLALADAPRALHQVRAMGADALVLDSIAAAYLGPWLARRPDLCPMPLIGMLHQPPGGIDFGLPRRQIQAWLDRSAYRPAHLLMLASEHLAEQFVAKGFPRERLRVVPPGRDVAGGQGAETPMRPFVPPRRERLRAGRRIALLSVGNWVARKDLLSLLEAVARLPQDAATLHLVGDIETDPAYATRVRRRLAQSDLARRVVVHGPRSRQEVAALYAASDAFALTSLKEPYGTVYGEAMAAGLPVVGWRAGNLPYLAEHEREGLLAPPGDIAGLSALLLRLAEDDELRIRLGAAARLRAEGRPTWEEVAALFFGTLAEVIEAHQPRPTAPVR